jgi:hypothetical protein
MTGKELYISHNVCISEGKVFSDGRLMHSYEDNIGFPDFGKYLYKKLNITYPKFYKMDNLCKLAFLACEFLIKSAGNTDVAVEQVSVILANSGSTIDTDTNFVESISSIPSPAIFVYTLPNISIGELCIRNGWKGEGLFLIQNEFNPKELIDHMRFIFTEGNTKMCIAGWSEFLSSGNYKTCLWMVSGQRTKSSRILAPGELSNDFNIL